MSFTQRLLNLTPRKLWLFIVAFSMIATDLLVCAMQWLLTSRLDYDYLFISFIASLIVSLLVVSTLHLFIKQQSLTVQRLQAFSEQIKAQSDELFEKNRQILLHEQQRQKSEQRLNALFENMSNGVAIFEACADGQTFFFKAFNRAAERIESTARERVLGKSVAEVFPKFEELGLLEVLHRVWRSGIDEYFPLAIYEQGVVTRWRENYIYKLPTGEIVVIYEDITQRKQTEAALQHSEAQFRAMIEASPVPYALNSAAQKIILLNSAFVQTFGYSLSDIPTLSEWWLKAYPDPSYRKWVIDTWQLRLNAAQQQDTAFEPLELLICCKNGSNKTVIVSVAALGQSFAGTHLVIFYDISDRKQAEQALHLLNKELLHYFEQPLLGMLTTKRDKSIIHVNQRFCDIVGYSKAEMQNLDWSKITHPDDLADSELFLERAIRGDIDNYQVEKRYIHKNGHIIHVHLAINCVHNAQGELDYFIGMMLDITERKDNEQRLRESNADLEQFAYSVSHDMRQPLRSIASHLQLLERGIGSSLTADNHENLAFALDGAQRMDAMIKSLLDYSRVGRKNDNKNWLSSRNTLNEAIDFLTAAIKESRAVLNITGHWPAIFASHDELVRLFLNLLSNAIKYREAEQSPVIDINATVLGNRWQVSVRDYGIGIDNGQIGRLFQFFSRLQARQRFEGTGMGLALCKRIVEHHQGTIWVESQGQGHGSCFIFSLPLIVPQLHENYHENK